MKQKPIIEYVRKVFALSRDRFKKSHGDFFAGAAAAGDEGKTWMQGLVREIVATKFHEAVEEGQSVTDQASPIYLSQQAEMTRNLLREGSVGSLQRASSLRMVGVAAGRPGEAATAAYSNLTWNPRHEIGDLTWAQPKTHKFKRVILMAAHERHLDIFFLLGLEHIGGVYESRMHEEDETDYMYPNLANSNQPATTVTNYIKPLIHGSSNRTYAMYQCPSLPGDATAAGIRVGAVDELACNGVSSDLAVVCTGHDMTSTSTFFHYLNGTVPLSIPGALVLNGWRAPPYGRLGEGALPARLQPLLVKGFMSRPKAEEFIDCALNLRRGMSFPGLLVGGSIRRVAETMVCTALMHYKETMAAREALRAMEHLRNSLVRVGLASSHLETNGMLEAWGDVLKADFRERNLKLIVESPSGLEVDPIVAAIHQLSSSLTASTSTLLERMGTQEKRMAELISTVDGLSSTVSRMGAIFSRSPPRSPARTLQSRSDVLEVATENGAVEVGPHASSSVDPSSSVASPTGMALQPNSELVLSAAKVGATAHTVAALKWLPGAGESTSLKGLLAKECFVKHSQGNLKVDAADKSRVENASKAFTMVARPAELSAIPGMSTAELYGLSSTLHDRLVGRLISAFDEAGAEMPRHLCSWEDLKVNSVSDRISELDKLKGTGSKVYKIRFTEAALSSEDISRLPKRPPPKQKSGAAKRSKM